MKATYFIMVHFSMAISLSIAQGWYKIIRHKCAQKSLFNIFNPFEQNDVHQACLFTNALLSHALTKSAPNIPRPLVCKFSPHFQSPIKHNFKFYFDASRSSYCGGCNAVFYYKNKTVNCDESDDTSVSQRQSNLSPHYFMCNKFG